MAPRKSKRKADEDVIKTEPDKRRATGNDEEDEAEEIANALVTVAPLQPAYINKRTTRASFGRKSISMAVTTATKTDFPFLSLPAEVRNMIYRLIVVSTSPKPIFITLDRYTRVFYGGICTSILFTNKQVSASQIDHVGNYQYHRFEKIITFA